MTQLILLSHLTSFLFLLYFSLITYTMASPLTSGFCQRAFSDDDTNKGEPVVQILSVKKINAAGQTGQDRFR
jgi:hypothetical protein